VGSHAGFHARVHRLAWTLERMGVKPGDRVGTLCWNSYRHLELYFAVPCYGAVLHTLNLRLAPTEIAYIANHAQDRFLRGLYRAARCLVHHPRRRRPQDQESLSHAMPSTQTADAK